MKVAAAENMSIFPADHDDDAPQDPTAMPNRQTPVGESGEHGPSRGGDREAWRDAFNECESGLRRFLAGKLPQAADVDDCLQSVLLAMLNNQSPIPPAARRAWLFRVAANEAAMWWRRKSTTDRVLEKHAETTYQVETDSGNAIESQETIGQINQAIENLPADARQIVRMRLRDGKTFQSIADELQLPLGTVLSRMRRSMQRLRDELNGLSDQS